MLHTKFRGNQPAGSGEEDFWLAARPVLESFSDIQCVFLEDSRRHCIFL